MFHNRSIWFRLNLAIAPLLVLPLWSEKISALPEPLPNNPPVVTPVPPEITPQQIAEQLANNYLNKVPITSNLPPLTNKKALQVQAEFIKRIYRKYGKVIGYKAGLTNSKAQENFNINQPVRGALLEKMLLPSGTIINSQFGTIPMLEGDLMVRVKSDKINQAKTPQEILNHLDAIIPFVELPDLVYQPPLKISAPELIAINAGARLGIIGKPLSLQPTKQWLQRLNNIEVVIFNQENKQIATGKSQALLGNPLKVVLWIKNSLKAEGKMLKKGDLLSLGTITPMIPVSNGQKFKIQYLGLDSQPLELEVTFANFPEF